MLSRLLSGRATFDGRFYATILRLITNKSLMYALSARRSGGDDSHRATINSFRRCSCSCGRGNATFYGRSLKSKWRIKRKVTITYPELEKPPGRSSLRRSMRAIELTARGGEALGFQPLNEHWLKGLGDDLWIDFSGKLFEEMHRRSPNRARPSAQTEINS